MRIKPLKHFCVGGPAYGLNVSADQYVDEGVRLLRTTDIDADGELAPAESAVYLDPSQVPAESLLSAGDLLLSRSGTLGRAFLVPERSDQLTYAGYLVRFRPSTNNDPRYLWRCAQSQIMQDAIGADAIQSTIGNFNGEKYANVELPAWPLDEQRAIGDYLDRETTRIDTLIATKKRMIGLVQERFQAHLEEVLSLSTVCETRVKFLATKIGSGKTPTGGADVYEASGIPFLRSQNVLNGQLDLKDVAFISAETDAEMASTRVKPGDVLFNITGASIGRCAPLPTEVPTANVNQHVCIVRPRRDLSGRLLHFALRTRFVQEQVSEMQLGGNRDGLNFEQVGNIRVGLPDDHRERDACESEVAAADSYAVSAVTAVNKQLDLLIERRQALITAAVTGQVEVPVAA